MRDKNVECKQRKTHANRGENHTEVITSPSKRKELMKILLSKQVLLPGKLIKRNCPSNNLKQGKILKQSKKKKQRLALHGHEIWSGEFPVLK